VNGDPNSAGVVHDMDTFALKCGGEFGRIGMPERDDPGRPFGTIGGQRLQPEIDQSFKGFSDQRVGVVMDRGQPHAIDVTQGGIERVERNEVGHTDRKAGRARFGNRPFEAV
jgi:hypothetical protein